MKRDNIESLDLSKFDSGFVSYETETIVSVLLIHYNSDIKKVCKKTNLSKATVEKIYLKNKLEIDRLSQALIDDTKLDNSINAAVNVLHEHLIEIEKQQSQSSRKIVSNLRDILAPLDRLVNLKKVNADAYNASVNKLKDTLIRTKSIELAELQSGVLGEDEALNEFKQNQITVYNLLKQSAPVCTTAKKTIRCENDGHIFSSIAEAANYYQVDARRISDYLNNKRDQPIEGLIFSTVEV